jgi:hypothetical protein
MSDESKTFDFGDSPITRSTFEDIESTADTMMEARGGVAGSVFRRIRHAPVKQRSWTKIGALATVVGVVVAVVFGLAQLF